MYTNVAMACVVLYSPAVAAMQNCAVMRSINLRPCCVTEETVSHIASFVTLCLTRPQILIFTLGNYTTIVEVMSNVAYKSGAHCLSFVTQCSVVAKRSFHNWQA